MKANDTKTTLSVVGANGAGVPHILKQLKAQWDAIEEAEEARQKKAEAKWVTCI